MATFVGSIPLLGLAGERALDPDEVQPGRLNVPTVHESRQLASEEQYRAAHTPLPITIDASAFSELRLSNNPVLAQKQTEMWTRIYATQRDAEKLRKLVVADEIQELKAGREQLRLDLREAKASIEPLQVELGQLQNALRGMQGRSLAAAKAFSEEQKSLPDLASAEEEAAFHERVEVARARCERISQSEARHVAGVQEAQHALNKALRRIARLADEHTMMGARIDALEGRQTGKPNSYSGLQSNGFTV